MAKRRTRQLGAVSAEPAPRPPALAPEPPARSSFDSWGVRVALAVILASVVVVGYLPAVNGGFIWDDTILLTEAPLVHAPDGLRRFWLTTEAPDYWPLTNTTFWLEWRLWGATSTGYHVTNVVLHWLTAILVFVLLSRLGIGGAYLAALLFAVHPVNVESVAWIAQRKNLVALLFLLPSCILYLVAEETRGSEGRTRRAGLLYGLSLTCFLLALFGKGSAATLPAVLLLLVYWRKGRLTRGDVVRVLPYFLLAVTLVSVNIWFQTHGTGPIRDASLAERVAGAGAVVWFYLSKALLPVRLAFVYPQWGIDGARLVWWIPLFLAGLVSVVLFSYRKAWARHLFLGWATFCVTLLPVMGLTDVYFMRFSLVADHYLHVSLIAVVALVAAGWSAWHAATPGTTRWLVKGVAVLVVGTLTALTARQSSLYESAETLYRATLALHPDSWLVHHNLAVELTSQGRGDEAFPHLEQAVRANPRFAEAHVSLAQALEERGRDDAALEHAQAAVRLGSGLPQARATLGAMLAGRGRHADALPHLQEAVRLRPGSPEARHNLGLSLTALGRASEAMVHQIEAVRLDPTNADSHNAVGSGLLEAGEHDRAIEAFRRALRLDPDHRGARANLAQALLRAGRNEEALAWYEEVARPGDASAELHYNLAMLLTAAGRTAEGRLHYGEALAKRPDYAEAHNNLAALAASEGRLVEALSHLEAAVRIKPDSVEARINLAEILARSGRLAEAVEQGRTARDLAPREMQPRLERRIAAWSAAYSRGRSIP